MASLNMAKVNTLIMKGYLLAGVMMAANIFVVNEVKAMNIDEDNMNNEKKEEIHLENKDDSDNPNKNASPLKMGLNFVLYWENAFNFIGTLFFSGANNYLKWWDYNPGGYWNIRIGCLGLRSKRFLNGMLQFEGNFNLGRGFFWLLLGAYNLIKAFATNEGSSGDYLEPLYVSILVGESVYKRFNDNKTVANAAVIVTFLLQGFVSLPLTLHFSKINLSISISLDSIIWGVAGFFLAEKEVPNEGDNQIDIDDNENDNKLKENDKESDNKDKVKEEELNEANESN